MNRFRLHGLAAAIIALGGCASTQPSGTLEQQAQFGGTTLGDLENTTVIIEQQPLGDTSTLEALNNYRKAAALFDDPERRATTLRRMADLALASATEHELKIDELEDEWLEQGGTGPRNYFGARQSVNYGTAARLYSELLHNTKDPQQRAEAYYLLSKAHAMKGDLILARESLDALVSEYPNSPWTLESQFRRGELLFSEGDYEYAEEAYADVIRRGETNEFYDQALYKHGWSHYKLGNYGDALVSLFELLDKLDGHAALADDTSMESKLFSDTQRVVSLAFSNQDGAQSVREWFAENGHRHYEADIYRNLGLVYLNQERFRDAGEAFDTFVQVYPDSELAPRFSGLQIDAYQKGGFPTLLLPAKEQYVEYYGVGSTYWQAHPDRRPQYIEPLKTHILDLAEYHHAVAQQSDDSDEFMLSAKWYKTYLDTPPVEDNQGDIHYRYAEALFSAQDYPAAISEFEHIAYGQTGYDEASQAGYAALVAYQKHLERPDLDEAASRQWRQRKIISAQNLISSFPEHESLPDVIRDTAEDHLALGDVKSAIRVAVILLRREPAPAAPYIQYGWATIANGEFDLGNYQVAEKAYGKLLTLDIEEQERSQYREKLALSIYRQAEQAQQAGDVELAAATYLRVGETVPESEVRKNAEFDAATVYINAGRSAEAIPVLEAFRNRYPDDTLTANIPDKLAIAYEQQGNYSAAAHELTLIAANNKGENDELSRQALWKAAEIQDRAEQPEASIALYQQYLQEWPEPYDFRSEAQFRLLELNRKTGNEQQQNFWLRELVTSYREAGSDASDRVAWLAAYASFTLAEPNFQAFNNIKLEQPLKASLAEKTTVMKAALADYQAVAEIGVAEYATAANYKIGEMYRVLAKDLIASERPTGMDELELEEYTMLLEDKALPYEDQAIDILIANANLVTDNIYDQWVKKSFGALAELIPGRYAKFEQVENYVDIIY